MRSKCYKRKGCVIPVLASPGMTFTSYGSDALKLVSLLLVVSYNLSVLPQAFHTNLLSLLHFLCNCMVLHPADSQNYLNIYGGKDFQKSKLLKMSFPSRCCRRVGGTKFRLFPALLVLFSPGPGPGKWLSI